MRSRGPSPLVPFLMVGVLSLVVFRPLMLSIGETAQSLLQLWEDLQSLITFLVLVLLIILLLLIHFFSVFFPRLNIYVSASRRSYSSTHDAEGFALGTLLLLLLFLILYNFL
ncbi:hypothetical protein NMG60_11023276 [Bertholletia excelsa]